MANNDAQNFFNAHAAALRLTDDPGTRQRMRVEFVTQAGSDKCREIRRAARIPCVECVRLAAHLLVDGKLKG
jgi:hypothetical protein